jgi:Fe-S cluster assembly iron-binding protein IscA
MLTLTPSAAAAVTALLDSPQVPDDAALRLQPGVDASGGTAIGLAVVTEPPETDTHIPVDQEHELLLAPEIAGLLDDQVLDAETQDENVAFTIRPQAVDGRAS